MSKLKNSPGTWSRCMANNGTCPCGLIFDSTGELVIAEVVSTCEEHEQITGGFAIHRGSEEYIANASLIAKAPELLETTIDLYKALYRNYESMTVSELEIQQGIETLIEEATGLTIEEVLNEN